MKAKAISEETISLLNMDDTKKYHELNDAIKNNSEIGKFFHLVSDKDKVWEAVSNFDTNDRQQQVDRLKHTIELMSEINKKKKSSYFDIRKISIISSVASAILFLSFLVWSSDDKSDLLVVAESPISIDSNVDHKVKKLKKPILIVGDKLEVNLNMVSDVISGAQLVGENTVDFTRTNDINKDGNDMSQIETYNTIKIPAQNILVVKLSDGTNVTLSANSTLRFPAKFYGETRTVYLTGKAFFDVKKSDRQFIVKLENDVDIKVYGTTFNINAYQEDNIQTVLVTGSVGVDFDSKQVMIKPSELISINNGNYAITHVNVDYYLDWMKGCFISKDKKLESVISDISEWYGVKFKFHKDIDLQKLAVLHIDRYKDIDKLLEILELALEVEISKEKENLYYVKPLK